MDRLYYPLTRLVNFLILNEKLSSSLKLYHIINTQKGGTGIFVLILMNYFSNFNPGCFLYLTLHGTYGLVWLLKDSVFPDKTFNKSVNFVSFVTATAFLLLYWVPAYIITSGLGVQFPSSQRIFVCVSLNILGTAVMMAADAQKHFTLKYKQGLISDGMFKYTRSPNFLGEFMIYFSFAVCVGTNECYLLIVGLFVTAVFSFIYLKEESNSKKKGWDEYVKHSFVLLPKVVPSSSFVSALVYFGLGVGIFRLVN